MGQEEYEHEAQLMGGTLDSFEEAPGECPNAENYIHKNCYLIKVCNQSNFT
jgi:hypothetical protein